MSAAKLRADNRIAFNGVAAAAAAAGVKPHHVRQALSTGALRSHAVSRRTVILASELHDWLIGRPAPKRRAKYNMEPDHVVGL